ncbi:unnamed protein product [Penicillium egyptiacum]|uniref:FAD-binding FR-type domain-containing protein n=1 Tax=Penicillium egyptiacum TaxID=1303716 RepID=A0A9W4KJH9_9EURO|nr:unnamed protein product [Penicillium egyptiacum]
MDFLNSTEGRYSLVVVAALLCIGIYHYARVASYYVFGPFRSFFLYHIAYPKFEKRIFGLQKLSRLNLIIGFLCLVGTAVCNAWGVHSLPQASSRAARLCLAHLIPMFFAGGYELGARILGISLQGYGAIHYTFGILAMLEALVHILIITCTQSVTMSNDLHLYGVLSASMLLALMILPLVKKRVYEVFLRTHQGCALVMIYTIWRHTHSFPAKSWLYTVIYISTLTITGIMQLARILFRNVALGKGSVQLALQRHGDAAQLTLELPRAWKVRAGERLMLGVPCVGLFYLFQAHPFTIVWWEVNQTDQTILVSLLFRPRNGFTRRLLERVEVNKKCRAWVDGPFGPCSVNPLGFSSEVGDYGHLLLIATGIGIAAQLPYIKEILEGIHSARVRTRRISLVWQLDRPGDWESAHGWLQKLVEQDDGYLLHVTVYDKTKSPHVNDPKKLGHHGLIEVYGGQVDWDEQLSLEMKHQVGKLLVADDELGLKVHPSHVRLKSINDDTPYTWKILDQGLLPLFQRHLSKHSIGSYKQLCSEIGKTFHVIGKHGAGKIIESPCHSDIQGIDRVQSQSPDILLRTERSQIVYELEEAKRNTIAEEKKRMLAETKVQYLMKRLEEAQNTIQYHQEEIQQWKVIAEYYQSSVSRCSNSLQEVITLLYGVQADVTFVPWNPISEV